MVTLVNMNTLLIQSEMYHAFYFNVIYIYIRLLFFELSAHMSITIKHHIKLIMQ